MVNKNAMKFLPVLLLFSVLVTNIQPAYGKSDMDWATQIETESMMDDIAELSSKNYQGRFSGSKGDILAQNYISNKLNDSNILPIFSNSYFQNFTLPHWSQPTDVNVTIGNNQLKYLTDYVEATLTGESNITTPTEIIFCGYGIETNMFNDYGGVSVVGKIVLVSTGGPPFVPYEYKYTSSKVNKAMEHGAIGLIIAQHPSEVTPFKKSTATEYGFQKNMATILANRTAIDQYINFTALINDLDAHISDYPNYSGEKSSITNKFGTMQILIDYKANVPSINILGQIKGNTDSYIIISAHYDHLGVTATNNYYPGADDDGSGVAVVLELARILSAYNSQNRTNKNIIFAFWSSEELGLIGSDYFVNHLPIQAEKIALVLHLDMIGVGPSDGYLYIDGGALLPTKTQSSLQKAGIKAGIPNLKLTDLEGGSDHVSFAYLGRPAVMLFWDNIASHVNYHTILDKSSDINPEVLKKVSLFIINYLFDYEMSMPTQTARIGLYEPILSLVLTSIIIKIRFTRLK